MLPIIHLIRRGETDWSAAQKHTGRTDLPLNADGERAAARIPVGLARSLDGRPPPPLVLTSPLARARRTSELAGFGDDAEAAPDLMEWDYGDYEGGTTAEIHDRRPGWRLFRDGCPRGENAEDVGRRVDRVIQRLRSPLGTTSESACSDTRNKRATANAERIG
jgi:probable phosphoglycerate mutase